MRAMDERVQLCQDPQTEFALLRESLGVSRINFFLRVHGHEIHHEEEAAQVFREVADRSLERLFPGFTDESREQATLSASQSGIGYKRARDVARPAHLGALVAAKPLIRDMIRSAATAGLAAEQPLLDRLDGLIQTASTACFCSYPGQLRDRHCVAKPSESSTGSRRSEATGGRRTQRTLSCPAHNRRRRASDAHLAARRRRFRSHYCSHPQATTQRAAVSSIGQNTAATSQNQPSDQRSVATGEED